MLLRAAQPVVSLHQAALSRTATQALSSAEGGEVDPQEAADWNKDAPAELDMQTPEERDMQLLAEAEAEGTAEEAGEAGLQTQARDAGEEGEGECCILAGTVRRRPVAGAWSASVVQLISHLFSHIGACDAACQSLRVHGLLDLQGELRPVGLAASQPD